MSTHLIVPVVIAALVVWRLYARMRRNFGRQPIRPKRMWTRVAILSAVAILIAATGLRNPALAEGLAAGLAGGALLGVVALRFTRFEVTGSNDGYLPNPWIGLALTALLLGRLLYRFSVLYPALAHGSMSGYTTQHSSPLTMAIFGLLIGYYIAYYAGLLMHHRRLLANQSTRHVNPEQPS